MKNNWISKAKGKIIRDGVHGDIFVPEEFIKVIDTTEFQRLRRIKQLSVASTVFPSAEHTRFSHSLGTFYIMSCIIQHFDEVLCEQGISIEKSEKNIALLAALLHDLGHGPFSHAFENIYKENNKCINHEEWTTRIIENSDGEIFKTLEENFGDGTSSKVADLIKKQRKIKKQKSDEFTKVDLFGVLSSLISSQLDADRMDYLLRDSMGAGVTFGKIDIERIIKSMQLTAYQDKYYVCVPEKFLPDIENYLLARYHMNDAVYYHDLKVEMEQIINKIFKRAEQLKRDGKLEFCSKPLNKMFSDELLNVGEYILLDDYKVIAAFQEWRSSEDVILANLCSVFLDRNKLKKLDLISADKFQQFKNDICDLLKQNNCLIDENYFFIESEKKYSAYKPNKENIWIERKNGTVIDISKLSKIVCGENENPIWDKKEYSVFINLALLEKINFDKIQIIRPKLDVIVENYNVRNNIEIEKKYYVVDENVFEKVEKFMSKQDGIKLESKEAKRQIDQYYDTKDFILKRTQKTLRIRQNDNRFEMTIKTKTESNVEENERYEYSKMLEKNNIQCEDSKKFIQKYLELDVKNLNLSLEIENNRKRFILNEKKMEYEMVFDRVKYKKGADVQDDLQIEIELKSAYYHRVALKRLTDLLEKEISGLEVAKVSKYQRGLELLSDLSVD